MTSMIKGGGAIAPRAFQAFNTEGRKRPVSLSLNNGLLQMVERYAQENDLSLSAAVRCLLLLGCCAAGLVDKEELQWHE